MNINICISLSCTLRTNFLHFYITYFYIFSCKVFLASKISKPFKRQGKRQILNVFCKSKRHFSQLQAGKKNTTALCHLLSCAIILHLIFQDFWLPVRLRKRFTWSLVLNNLLWIILLYFKTETHVIWKEHSCTVYMYFPAFTLNSFIFCRTFFINTTAYARSSLYVPLYKNGTVNLMKANVQISNLYKSSNASHDLYACFGASF